VVLAFLLLLAGSASFEDSFRAGLLALQRNDLTEAASNLEGAAKLSPANGRVWVALSQTYRKLGDQQKAEDAARKAVAVAPADPVVRQMLSISYFEVVQPLLRGQKFADAIGVLEPARRLLPGSAQIELALGVAYYGLRRFDDAAAAFLRTIAIAPETEQPYVFLGKFLDQIPDRLPEVAKHFIEYEKANPSSAIGYLLHAKALDAQAADPELAAKLLGKSLAIDGNDASAHFELATVFDRLQRFEEASGEFEKCVALDPANSAAHYRLARDYDRLGRHDAAQTERERHTALVKAEGALP
jgi:tetratricopeptide (TPR) repeat protein